MTVEEWTSCTNLMRAAYGKKLDLDTKAFITWFGLLEHLPGDRMLAATRQMCMECEWPSVPTLNRLATVPDVSGEVAWSAALAHSKNNPMYPLYRGAGDLQYQGGIVASPTNPQRVEVAQLDPLTAGALTAIGGVDAIRNTRDINFLRKDFVKQYEAMALAGKHGTLTAIAAPVPEQGQKVIDIQALSRSIGRPMPEAGR